MTDQPVNIPLLRKAVEWAEAEAAKPQIDSAWAQDQWRTDPDTASFRLTIDFDDATSVHEEVVAAHCGTSYCIAGYVAQALDERYANDIRPDGMPHVADFAAEALGLEPTDRMAMGRGHLFYEGNTIEDVRRIAESLAGERL